MFDSQKGLDHFYGKDGGLGGSPSHGLMSAMGIEDPMESTLFGNNNKPGLLGMGQFTPQGYAVNQNAANIDNYVGDRGTLYNAGVNAARRQAPVLDQTQSNQWRGQQMTLAQQLADQANGVGPSIAQDQLRRATDRNLAQAMALGQSMQGASAGGALRGIQNQQAGIAQQSAMDSGLLRSQEQMAARQQLGQLLSGARQQDIGIAGADQQSLLQQQAMNDSLVKFYTDAGLSLAQAQTQARLKMEELKVQQNLGMEQLRQQGYDAAGERQSKLLSSIGGPLAMLFG